MRKKIRICILLLIIVLLLPFGITFSKFVKEKISYYIMEAKKFYFNSDKLVSSGKTYYINNWGGVDSTYIQFELNNEKNNILHSTSDINYTLTASCSSGVTCTLSTVSGIIYSSQRRENFTLTVTPQRAFNADEFVTVNVVANATSPYEKQLSATFVITVGKEGINYEIVDAINQPYLNLIITNSRNSYKVNTAFGSYSVGSELSTDAYLALSDTDRLNCSSAMITLTFDPHIVILDTTSEIVDNSTKSYTNIDGISYISSITFDIDALSNMSIRFYKIDRSENYTFPIVNDNSIVTFNAV